MEGEIKGVRKMDKHSLEKVSKRELKKQINEYEDITSTCYSVKDLLYLDMLYLEASRRGYEVQKKTSVNF